MTHHPDDEPLLSVVVAARDAGRWIDEALDSLLAQGSSVAEVVVVDNGSVDDTAERVAVVARTDARVRILASTAPTAAAARNEGVEVASGRYLAFADADDIVPDRAYSVMVASLEASGSDMVIGDHLKFSATRTWSPTRRWYPFREAVRAAAPEEVPELLSGRACWNRVFRRSAWDRAGLRFPDVRSVEDIQPMTRAFVEARAIDVVPYCVYLYRDRGDTTSLSLRADVEVTVRYLEQELACAGLVSGNPVLRAQHAAVVLDADGWSHLHRFLLTDPDAAAMATVAHAMAALVGAVPLDGLSDVAPARRALWALVLQDDWSAARSFVLGGASTVATERVGAWIDAVARISAAQPALAEGLAREGLVPTLVNLADEIDAAWLANRMPAVAAVDLQPSGAVLADAMAAAVRAEDHDSIPRVSALRRVVPLLVDRVEATATGLTVGGPVDLAARGLRATLLLTAAEGRDVASAVLADDTRWRADVAAEGVTPGRHTVSVSFAGVDGRFPVVTVRMPLPPVAAAPMQPLADRRDGWRFLVDRRAPERKRLRRILAGLARRLR